MQDQWFLLGKEMAAQLSSELRLNEGNFLDHRRTMIILLLVAIFCMGLISLYQLGIIKHLPEPPIPYLNADKVDASPQAYQFLSVPDAVLGLLSYSITFLLVAMGGAQRWENMPLIPLLMGIKVLHDAINAFRLSVAQWVDHRAFCFWCLLAALATFAILFLAIPETRAALKTIFS